MSVFYATLRATFSPDGEDEGLGQQGDHGVSGQKEDAAQLHQDHGGQGKGQVLEHIQDIGKALMTGVRRCRSGEGQNIQAHGKDEKQQDAYEEIGKAAQEHEACHQAAVQMMSRA